MLKVTPLMEIAKRRTQHRIPIQCLNWLENPISKSIHILACLRVHRLLTPLWKMENGEQNKSDYIGMLILVQRVQGEETCRTCLLSSYLWSPVIASKSIIAFSFDGWLLSLFCNIIILKHAPFTLPVFETNIAMHLCSNRENNVAMVF